MTSPASAEGPRYKWALRILGRYLNQRRARVVTVGQIEGGFLLHFAADGLLQRLEGMAVHDDDLYDLERIFRTRQADAGRAGVFAGMQSFLGFRRDAALRFQKSHPVCPQGYEQVLRTLGSRLDAQQAADVVITEMPTQIVLEYTVRAYGHAARLVRPDSAVFRRHETYGRRELEMLVAAERERAERAIVGTAERLRLDPHDHRLYMDAGRRFHDQGELAEAAELYRMVISLLPQHLEAYHRLAELNLERGHQKDAVSWLTKALQVDAHDARSHDLLGMAYRRLGQLDKARESFEQAVVLDPTHRAYRLHLVAVLPADGSVSTAAILGATGVLPDAAEMGPLAQSLASAALDDEAPPAVGDAADPLARASAAGEALTSAGETGPPTAPLAAEVSASLARLMDDTLGWDATPTPGMPDALGWVEAPATPIDAAPATPTDAAPAAAPDQGAQQNSGDTGGDDPFDRGAALDGSPEAEAAGQADLPEASFFDADSVANPPPPEPRGTPAWVDDVPPTAPARSWSVSAVPEEEVEATIANLRAAIAAAPGQRDLHRKLGFLLARQGRTAEAAREFDLARSDDEVL